MRAQEQKGALEQEHQSKALLIKLVWIMLAGLCLMSISALRWDDTIHAAYFFAKVGVSFWLIAGLGLLAAANLWLKDTFLMVKVYRALWGFAVLWFAIAVTSWFLAAGNLPLIDIAGAIFAFCYLPIAKRMRRNIKRMANIDGVAWLLSAISLMFAAIVWGDGGATISWISTGLLFLLALLTACFCFFAPENIGRDEAKASNSETTTSEQSPHEALTIRSPLNYVRTRTDLLGWIVIIYCVVALFGTIIFLKDRLIGPTIVMVLVGFTSALMTIKTNTSPKFADRLRVFSSAMGTQFIFPTQLLLDDKVFKHVETLAGRKENRETDSRRGK